MTQPLFLVIDVGTGSVRAAAVDKRGTILAFANQEHDQHVPRYGWCEQRPDDWWQGAASAVRKVVDALGNEAARIECIACCGQMHGTVLVDDAGNLTREYVPLWNDKRTIPQVEAYQRQFGDDGGIKETGSPATPAWPGFKLQWLAEHEPALLKRSTCVMMPKDYINARLTGNIAFDITEASLSFMMDADTHVWSPAMLKALGINPSLLPPLRKPLEILGAVTEKASRETGLRSGIPVAVGGGDFPLTLLGSGACKPGLGSDVTGTSSIITLIQKHPVRHPELSNVMTPEGNWGAFTLLDAGGDAVRWARRAMNENTLSYAEATDKAKQSPAGSRNLFFLPYLTGERLGETRNSRAMFFGLNSGHGLADLHRAVLEGVAFAVRRHIEQMSDAGQPPERIIAASGGAKSQLWLEIKASMYGIPILVPSEPECGVIGCTALAATASGYFNTLEDAAGSLVSYEKEIKPNPAWLERYNQMFPLFKQIKEANKRLYRELDALDPDTDATDGEYDTGMNKP